MRPRAFDGEPCEWCLGHQPADCPCQPGADFLDMDRRQALSLRSHGWSLIVLCMMTIEDPEADNAAAEGAFNTRDRLAGKHGMPDAEWIDREREWLAPRYGRAKDERRRFKSLDDAWREDNPLSTDLPPSYSAAILDDAAASYGFDAEISYEERFADAPPLQL